MKEKRNNISQTTAPLVRKIGILIHVAVWTIPLWIPFFFTGRSEFSVTPDFFFRNCIIVASFAIVFYSNYFYLIRRFLTAGQVWKFIFSNLLLALAVMSIVHLIMQQLPPPEYVITEGKREHDTIQMAGFMLRNLFMYSAVIVLSVAIRMTGNWFQMETMRKDLEKSRAEAELTNLKSQLNPHFLFNTLNNIYSLIALSPEQAQETIHELSRLLRYVLYESSQPFVSVAKELDFVSNYIELMRIRLAKNVELQTEINIENEEAQVAPLLFITLIENAFKHGISNSKPSFIHIRITQKNKELDCVIENSFFPKDQQDKSGSGIGLPNLEKRLALLYPETYSLQYGREGEVYKSELSIILTA
ncbi:histidine kinase [Massilibacteroides sp.]|uniref:sensor histidine kinase n=1 Tax=Massilibacteroides sp. TaxID=2034766 RepID=UPI0026179FDA|nr:histidine kinase [Massilibacteroides sp.]MDD4514671.1 histidine kinase [Massilibacteroides sp.]